MYILITLWKVYLCEQKRQSENLKPDSSASARQSRAFGRNDPAPNDPAPSYASLLPGAGHGGRSLFRAGQVKLYGFWTKLQYFSINPACM